MCSLSMVLGSQVTRGTCDTLLPTSRMIVLVVEIVAVLLITLRCLLFQWPRLR